MSSALSKRQQVRNEKALQDLLHSVAGNNFCADCQAQNPAWASWSLGIFLCMRCATIHRKLGTHVSKVKSLSMDSWTNEQVDNMRKAGNVVSNKLYNPDGKKPPVPIDVDEADSVMERFIRQKYISRTMSTSKRRPGAGDSDDNPPPLPPKPPTRLGIRSASSIFPLGSKSKKASEPTSPRSPQPPLRNKSSGLFGVSVERDSPDGNDTDRKLARLYDMGFTDDHRNAMVLKGVGGNLEKAIEALVRLGEGNGRGPTLLTPARAATMPLTRSLTPGANLDTSRARPISPASTNPFDMLDTPQTPQPLSSQSTGTLQTKNPYLSTNPFDAPQQKPSAIDLAFQNMSLAAPSQPLFPHHTGGMAQQQHNPMMYQQPMTAPLTAPLPLGAQGYSGMAMNGAHGYPQAAQPSPASYNPFLAGQPAAPQPLSINTAQFGGGGMNTNPFTRSPTKIQSPTLSQIPEQTQQNYYTQTMQPVQGMQTMQPQATNPFFSQMAPQQQQQQQQQFPGQMHMPQQQQQQHLSQHMGLAPQMTGYFPQQQFQQPRPNTASIMALYNYPQPSQPLTQQQQQTTPAQTPNSALFPAGTFPQHQQPQPQQATPISPGMASKNPFAAASAGPNAAAAAGVAGGRLVDATPRRDVSRESMMAVGLEWSNGRHSPDAFASLSARDGR
ncbi:hypothetical protein C8A05DRAFT_17279 [Staphylotrichum tortipilum]|uniref:UBA domain-containing protein 3 n=1 Tax=Staphylotrichum tortipilum TaxID=2831512 RepID=A0AAN6MI94_9PEZI|nr:hypothetical protein C8A05DRAFT_17279 [Staphylotrichum longicolle]